MTTAYNKRLTTQVSDQVATRLDLVRQLRGQQLNEVVDAALLKGLPSDDELAAEAEGLASAIRNGARTR